MEYLTGSEQFQTKHAAKHFLSLREEKNSFNNQPRNPEPAFEAAYSNENSQGEGRILKPAPPQLFYLIMYIIVIL